MNGSNSNGTIFRVGANGDDLQVLMPFDPSTTGYVHKVA
jgi:hypothetical protein